MLKKSSISNHTNLLKQLSKTYGFAGVGISEAVPLDNEARKLESWLNKGYHGNMAYLEDHFDLRIDPSKFFPAAKTIISFVYNYFPEEESLSEGDYKIARYAYGRDYHKVVVKKLRKLISELKESIGDFHARAFVDSAPIMEREWAEKSGLGWKAKNTLLINKNPLSVFLISPSNVKERFLRNFRIRWRDGCLVVISARKYVLGIVFLLLLKKRTSVPMKT